MSVSTVLATHHLEQPLPLYTPADAETSSVHSSAPSYKSETPTYHSTLPPAHSLVESGPPRPPRHASAGFSGNADLSAAIDGRLQSSAGTVRQEDMDHALPESRSPPHHAVPPNSPSGIEEVNHLSHHYNHANRSSLPVGRPPRRLGLPPVTYAPGFRYRPQQPPSSSSSPSILNINVNELRSIHTGPKAPIYRNITARRARKAAMDDRDRRIPVLTLKPLFAAPGCGSTSSSASSASSPTSPPAAFTSSPSSSTCHSPLTNHPNPAPSDSLNNNTTASATSAPLSPYEDPELVGAEAAAQARTQRIYLASCRHHARTLSASDQQALVAENLSWDFMLGQMADWKERERNWQRYQTQLLEQRGSARIVGTGWAKRRR